ncbi:MAG: 2-amino-4-hydroxy-6-hydroxymethyldihydropteridine diphosphokinase [Gemmatimonadota bacterium]|nr:2-amino-4-hydroxy-6-hydroxymethyldihydropteridine diphosphokinase [Gemmatimonadota bacterium]
MSTRAYLSLGSNLGDRAMALGEARRRLVDAPDLRLVAASAVVETAPVDLLDQPDFLNQVVGLDVDLSPERTLETCLAIERGMGRDRSESPPGGPRTIDLDLLLYGGRSIDEPGLTVPHPRLAERGFLLRLLDQVGAPASWIPEPVEAR